MSDFIHRDLQNLHMIHRLDAYMVGHKGFIAGGAFKNIINGEDIKDVDIYFESVEDFNEAVKYYEDNSTYRPSYENEKVIAFFNKRSKIRVELIRVFFGTPEDIVNQFDFTITKFAYYKEYSIEVNEETKEEEEAITYKVLHHKDFFEHLHLKRLVVDNKIIRPGSTYERTYKYHGYGYKLCRESKVRIIEALRSDEFTFDDLGASLYDGLD